MSMARWAIRPVSSVCHGFTYVYSFCAGIDEFEILKWTFFSPQWLQYSTALYGTPQDLHDTMDVKCSTVFGSFVPLCETRSQV